MFIRPANDRVVVKRDPSEKQTPGGIYLPDSVQAKPQIGLVVAVGPGKQSDLGVWPSPPCSQGDRVLFTKHAGDEFKFDRETVMLVRFSDILAVIEDDPPAHENQDQVVS